MLLDYLLNNNYVKRTFIGIPIGCQIKSILPLIKSSINCKISFIKWIPSKKLHLTLYFLGEISNNDISNLIQSINNNISTTPFQISISGTGVFPSLKSPKVLWLGINKGTDELKLLHSQIDKSIKEYNYNYEVNTFIPHITIARMKQTFGKIDVLPLLDNVYSPIELQVNSICMYESKLYPEGAQYTVLNTFPLK